MISNQKQLGELVGRLKAALPSGSDDIVHAIGTGLLEVLQGAPVNPGSGFGRLLRPGTFIEDVYGGLVSEEERKSARLPSNLVGLLEDGRFLQESGKLVRGVRERAASVLEGVKERGRREGDCMDEETEKALAPMLLREAFARELCAQVRHTAAQSVAMRALVTASERESAGGGGEEVEEVGTVSSRVVRYVSRLFEGEGDGGGGVLVDREVLGAEWKDVIAMDARRFIASNPARDKAHEAIPGREKGLKSAPASSDGGWQARAVPVSDEEATKQLKQNFPALWVFSRYLSAITTSIGSKSLKPQPGTVWVIVESPSDETPKPVSVSPSAPSGAAGFLHANIIYSATHGYLDEEGSPIAPDSLIAANSPSVLYSRPKPPLAPPPQGTVILAAAIIRRLT